MQQRLLMVKFRNKKKNQCPMYHRPTLSMPVRQSCSTLETWVPTMTIVVTWPHESRMLASEAEVVATRIFGKGMTLREQQDRAWKEETTSIFDLERMEIEAEQMGEIAPWANPDAGDEMMPGFDMDGKMKIGGS